LGGEVVVFGFAFVEGKALEDEGSGLFGGVVVEFDKAGGVVEALDGREFEPRQHDCRVVAIL